MEKIEKIFYEDIIKEAAYGYIDCDFFIPICFGTKELVNNELKDITIPKDFDNAMIPTLIIKDREKLINGINEYVNLASEFYKDDIRFQDTSLKEKYLIACLLSNTLVTDFNDLDCLFTRHSNFMRDNSFDEFFNVHNLGYSEILKSNLCVKVTKQGVLEETPYGIDSFLVDEEDNEIYRFPTVRFGISDEKAYIYAIQGRNNNENKKIERILRKTGEGFDEKNTDRDPIENPENLYSVSPWSLVALTVAVSLIKNNTNVKEFCAPYFLINRWNAVEVSYQNLKEKYKDRMDDALVSEVICKKQNQVLEHEDKQRNITDKFLRTIRRLDHHFSNVEIDTFQLEMDSSLHFTVDDDYECNNSLLNEVYNLASVNKNNSIGTKPKR